MDDLRTKEPSKQNIEHNLKLEDVEQYRATTKILVEDLMKRISEEDRIFAGYKITRDLDTQLMQL